MATRLGLAALGAALWLAAGPAWGQDAGAADSTAQAGSGAPAEAGLGTPAQAGGGAEVIGIVQTAEGDALILREGESFPAETGTEVFRDDRVVTGEDGKLGIVLSDGTALSMGRRSSVVLDEFEFAPRDGLFSLFLRLLAGTFVYGSGEIGQNAPDAVRIETPSATIATRGTRLGIRVAGAEP